jgi:hypothetical protein
VFVAELKITFGAFMSVYVTCGHSETQGIHSNKYPEGPLQSGNLVVENISFRQQDTLEFIPSSYL